MTELSPAIEAALVEYRVQVRGNWSGLGEHAERKAENTLRAAILAEQQSLRTLLDDAHMLLIHAGASTQQRMDMAHRIARYLRANDLSPRSADEGEA